MAKATRIDWDRETHLEELYGTGSVKIPRYRFIYLGGQMNWCPKVLRAWLNHWHEYVGNPKDDRLFIHSVGEYVYLYLNDWEKTRPRRLSEALAAAS